MPPTRPQFQIPAVAPVSKVPPASSLSAVLAQAVEQIACLGEAFCPEGHELRILRNRLAEERFHLAVLGQFKRGKSTLLNALLRNDILPVSVTPLTAVPTFLLFGNEIQLRILYQNGQPPEIYTMQSADELTAMLDRFVTEEGNPKNQRQVTCVEVYYPSPLLRGGVVLIDTPGIGSTYRHNTEATLNFLPQCDAALFVVSADPPLTEVEVEFLKEVRTRVSRLFFILNKVDYLTSVEQQTALAFLEKVLQEQAEIELPHPIFPVSARQGLRACQTNNPELWEQSGLADLENYLLNFLLSEKTEVLQSAVARKAGDVLSNALMKLHLSIRSLQLPVDDLNERRKLFEQKIAEAEQQRLMAQDLLAGDHKRLVSLLEEQAELLRQEARQYLNQVVYDALANMTEDTAADEIAQKVLAEAIPGFFERELGKIRQNFEQRVTKMLEGHRQRADDLVETIRRAAAEIFQLTYRPLESQGVFVFEHQPYWVTYHWRTGLSPFSPQLIDRLMPAHIRRARRLRRLQEQIEKLVIYNVENLRWATLQNLDQAIRRFSNRLDERLQETITVTRGAVQSAQQLHQRQTDNIADILVRLNGAIQDLEQLQARIQVYYDFSQHSL